MATTPNYSFSVYSSTDTDVRFLDFRVATAGSQSTSNFYVIDTVLKQHSDAIDSINATPSAFVVKGTYSSGSLYTASVANYPGYKNEQLIVLSLNQKNTGAVQININGTTNKDVMKYGSDGVLKAVDAGDFVANSPVLCLYDGTRFVVIGITSASSITVTGEAGDILQIADDGTIESSGKKAAQPNGIATLDENGNVVQVANMANSAAAVYSGEPVTVEYAGAQRIASITAYGENAQGGTTEAPVALTGVDSVQVCGKNMLPNEGQTSTAAGITYTINPDKSITAKGTATSWSNIVLAADFFLSAGTYTLNSNTQAAGVNLVIGKDTSGTKNIAVSSTASKTFTLSDSIKHCVTYISVAPDSVVDTTIRPMLNLGSTAMPYEPYQGSVTTLPIPRPLRKVGDVRDVCQTRVKSIYDKRIVLDGTEAWAKRTNVSIVGGSAFYPKNFITDALPNAPVAVSDYFVGRAGLTTELWEARQVGSYVGVQFNAPFAEVSDFTAWLAEHPLTVYYRSAAYDGTNGLDVCLTEYQTGFVELDGTEASHIFEGMFYLDYSASWPTPANRVNGVCSHYPYGAYGKGKIGLTDNGAAVVYNPNGDYTGDEGGLANWKAYLAAQKEAGTPVQVAYQLAAPEVYATDPLTIDNAAGPLTVVTGGQVEVKMTDFVTDRTPAFLNKLDKTGDGSDVTVTFTEAATDTDIASGDKLSILFGKILKRFTNILNGTTKVGYATKADTDNLGNQITETYANSLDVADNTIVLKNKIGENLSTITVPYANSAGNVATSIKEMGIAVQTASPYAWFLNYTGSGNKDGARKYYASVYADNATYSTSAGSSNNIVIYNNNWSGTDGSISAVYANAEKTYVSLASSNAAGTAWPNISVQRINGHALNMALNGTSLSITW
jgi:hypothetical protein